MSTPTRAVNPWLIAVAVVVPTFMEVLDTTIANVALPYMQGSVSASQDFTSRFTATRAQFGRVMSERCARLSTSFQPSVACCVRITF